MGSMHACIRVRLRAHKPLSLACSLHVHMLPSLSDVQKVQPLSQFHLTCMQLCSAIVNVGVAYLSEETSDSVHRT